MMAASVGSAGSPFSIRPARLLAMLVSLPFCAGAADLSVTAVRFWSLGDVTRIAVETSREFTFRTDHINNPSRHFFDLRGAKPVLDKKGTHIIAVKDTRVRQIRVAETQPSVTRVVLDMEEGEFDISTSQLTGPDRLMIEVRSKGENSAPTLSSTGVRRIPKSTEVEPEKPQEPSVLAKPAAVSLVVTDKLAGNKRKLHSTYPEAKAVEPPVLTSRLYTPKMPVQPQYQYAPPPSSEPVEEEPATKSPDLGIPRAAKFGNGSLTRILGLKVRRVIIDPGHGGHDNGTTGHNGLVEKDLVMDVAKRLGDLITGQMGSEVMYTRAGDKYIGLEERSAMANSSKADLFLSIHANSSPIRSASGVETYYLSFTPSRTALEVAARENAASERNISELKELLQKIAFRDKIDESREFASKVQTSLTSLMAASQPAGPKAAAARSNRGVKRAPFVVLIGAQMPSILTEIGFVTNTREESLLMKPEYRQKIAEAIFKGIKNYSESLSKFEVGPSRRISQVVYWAPPFSKLT